MNGLYTSYYKTPLIKYVSYSYNYKDPETTLYITLYKHNNN